MSKATFPSLLTKKATMLGSLTRSDLAILGGCYLIFSWMKISGIFSIMFNLIILILVKFAQKRFNPGFFRLANDPKKLEWSYNCENLNE